MSDEPDDDRVTEADMAALDAALLTTLNNEDTGFALWSARHALPDEWITTALDQAMDRIGLADAKRDAAVDHFYGRAVDVTAVLVVRLNGRVICITGDSAAPVIVIDPAALGAQTFPA